MIDRFGFVIVAFVIERRRTTNNGLDIIDLDGGWTIFGNLYLLYSSTLYIVRRDVNRGPELQRMTSTGVPASSEPGNDEARGPTGQELKFLSAKEAKELWGDRTWAMEGMTWLFNDGQFIDHYYHFATELLLGAWGLGFDERTCRWAEAFLLKEKPPCPPVLEEKNDDFGADRRTSVLVEVVAGTVT